MKDNRKNKTTNEQLANNSVKRAVDGVYDLIMANALFIFFNVHIILFLLFFNPTNIVLFYLYMGFLSLNLLPSYTAIMYVKRKGKDNSAGIIGEFRKGYRENFRSSFMIGALGILVITFTLYNAQFFYITEMNLVYRALQILAFFVIFAVLATIPVIIYDKGTLKEVLSRTKKDFFKRLLGAAAAGMIILLSLYLVRIIAVTLIFGFGLAAVAQDALYRKLIGETKNRK